MACSGQCFAGFYCPAGSTSPSQYECGGVTQYCPPGSGRPKTVDMYHYTVGPQGTDTDTVEAELLAGSDRTNILEPTDNDAFGKVSPGNTGAVQYLEHPVQTTTSTGGSFTGSRGSVWRKVESIMGRQPSAFRFYKIHVGSTHSMQPTDNAVVHLSHFCIGEWKLLNMQGNEIDTQLTNITVHSEYRY